MDESRKQFLEWFGEEFESINNSEELHVQAIKMIAWQSWVKSRAAIEIELPEAELVYSTATDTYGEDGCLMLPVDMISRMLNSAGIKVKE